MKFSIQIRRYWFHFGGERLFEYEKRPLELFLEPLFKIHVYKK